MVSKNELDEIFDIKDITTKHVQDEKPGPLINEFYKKLRSKNSSNDACLILLTNYSSSPFGDTESYLRFVVGLDEDDFQLISNQYNSKFVFYEIPRDVYSIEGISDVVYTMGDHKGTLGIEHDDISLKKKLNLSPLVTLKFNEKSFVNTLLDFTPFWDYKPTKTIHVDSPGVYTSEKSLTLSTINKIHLECDFFDGSIVDGSKQAILLVLFQINRMVVKYFPNQKLHYKKLNEFVSNTITFFLEHDNHAKVNFNGETTTFALQLIKF